LAGPLEIRRGETQRGVGLVDLSFGSVVIRLIRALIMILSRRLNLTREIESGKFFILFVLMSRPKETYADSER
jgi:hypothetical protein